MQFPYKLHVMFRHDVYQLSKLVCCGFQPSNVLASGGLPATVPLRKDGNIWDPLYQYLTGLAVNTLLVHAFAFQRSSMPVSLKASVANSRTVCISPVAITKVFRRIVLQDKPHTFHMVFGISPVAACIQIAQIQFVLESLCNAGGSQRNLAGNEGFAAALAFRG